MIENKIVDVVIPAYNEENSIPLVLNEIPDFVRNVIVVNNNSTDNTASVAMANGAVVLSEERQGYGSACLKGIEHIKQSESHPDILVFLDADYSDYPTELDKVIAPILNDNIDMVIGSRALGDKEDGAMMPQQIFGNKIATALMKLIYGVQFTDLGPFRAIKFDKLLEIGMRDKDYGWTVEMQIKAVKNKLSFCEVPVTYRKRVGVSKIAGTFKGTVMAGYKIIFTLFKYA
ncbi:MAG: glycosyltransferase family 2 protein [Flavobacteriales bacterium]|jgi:glycosyltransferase involved in cell wall biosynthesis|nr:glycosyltransferase family 2 protein [Flavobacteriales bacterium]